MTAFLDLLISIMMVLMGISLVRRARAAKKDRELDEQCQRDYAESLRHSQD